MIQLLILFFLSGFWFLLTINSAAGEFSPDDRIAVFTLVSGVFGIQLLLLLAARFWSKRVSRLMTPLFAVMNFVFLHAVFIVALSSLMIWQQLLLLLLILLIAYAFFGFVASLRKKGYYVAAISVLLFAVQGGIYLRHDRDYTVAPPPPGQTSAPEVALVKFQKTPNIYLISYDAMAPQAVVEEYLGIKELGYQQWMERRGFRRFKNAFSHGAETRTTFNRMLAMHPEYYRRLAEKGRQHHLVNGRSPSPLREIFKANGYRAHVYYRNNYFGMKSGPHVDSYNLFYPFSTCYNHAASLAIVFGFYSYCPLLLSKTFMSLWGMESRIAAGFPRPDRVAAFALEDISERLAGGGRHVFMVHLASPGHTPLSYNHNNERDYNDFISEFSHKNRHQTPALMQTVFDYIQEKDPDAIVLYYADHGLGLSRHYEYDQFDELPPDIQRFMQIDRYGILMGIYPPATCRDYFDSYPPLRKYADITMVMRQLLRCLAGGEDPLPGFSAHGFYNEYGDDARHSYQGEEPGSYEEYLYE